MQPDPNDIFRQAHEAHRIRRHAEARQLLLQLLKLIGEHPDVLHLLGSAEAELGDLGSAERRFSKALSLSPQKLEIVTDWARLLREAGLFQKAESVLQAALARSPEDRRLLIALALLKREEGDRDTAAAIFDRILAAEPGDAYARNVRARLELERGGDARRPYVRALEAAPDDPATVLGAAAAFYHRGETAKATELLAQRLSRHPDWLEGLQTVSRMRWQSGDERFGEDFERALAQRPRDAVLWGAYLQALGSTGGFSAALEKLPQARTAVGDHALLDMVEAEALSETGSIAAADARFRALTAVDDPSFNPARMRHLLRRGRADAAAELGERSTAYPGAAFIWPYLSVAWRLLGDERWQWLERPEDTVAVIDLEPLKPLLPELATFLRRLHLDKRHPFDQSPRGGTQTDGALFDRTEPIVAELRRILMDAVQEYARALPASDPSHPFLGRPREPLRFAGSWSIRLLDGGYHVSHVHPQGWLSSALYISLPEAIGQGEDHSGWLALGSPPEELGLQLEPFRLIEPRAARLVLFPSIMWHGTMPFRAGERLTVAFDVVPRERRPSGPGL